MSPAEELRAAVTKLRNHPTLFSPEFTTEVIAFLETSAEELEGAESTLASEGARRDAFYWRPLDLVAEPGSVQAALRFARAVLGSGT